MDLLWPAIGIPAKCHCVKPCRSLVWSWSRNREPLVELLCASRGVTPSAAVMTSSGVLRWRQRSIRRWTNDGRAGGAPDVF